MRPLSISVRIVGVSRWERERGGEVLIKRGLDQAYRVIVPDRRRTTNTSTVRGPNLAQHSAAVVPIAPVARYSACESVVP